MTTSAQVSLSSSQQGHSAYDPLLDDIGYMTCMTLTLLEIMRRPGISAGRSHTLRTMLLRI